MAQSLKFGGNRLEGIFSQNKMLGNQAEPSAKKAKYEKQKLYNEKRKEKPRKPQFSLNFQFNFGEEEEMRATNDRFVRLRNMAILRSGRANADFLQVLMDFYEEGVHTQKEMHSVAVQANATESVFQLYAQGEVEKSDFQCQWPSGELEAPACRQILSPASPTESFFVCGQDSLATLLTETAGGCTCGAQYSYDEESCSKHMDGHVLRLEFSCENGHKIKWASSSILGNKYTVNCR